MYNQKDTDFFMKNEKICTLNLRSDFYIGCIRRLPIFKSGFFSFRVVLYAKIYGSYSVLLHFVVIIGTKYHEQM